MLRLNRITLFLLILLALNGTLASTVGAQEIVFDFENGTQDWKVLEGRFGDIRSARSNFFNYPNVPYNKNQKFHLTSLELQGNSNDSLRGIMESPVWKNSGSKVTLLVGGGKGKDVYVALCEIPEQINNDSELEAKEIFQAKGNDVEKMLPIVWDTSKLIGKNLLIRMYDNSTGGWGHITLDNVRAEGKILPDLTVKYRSQRKKMIPSLPEFREVTPTVADPKAKDRPELTAHPILFVAREQYRRDHHNTATIFQTGEINEANFTPGAALRIADFAKKDANGNPKITTILDCPNGKLRDPDVSFDGKKILFSMRRDKNDDYHIYEMNADGSGLRQITFGSGLSDIDPIYLPNGRILFSSTREPKYCMCNRHIMCNLYTMNSDGSDIDQIGHSTLFEGHSSLLMDGRVIYDRWEYVDRNFGDAQGLWVTNPDGTSHLLFWGNNTESPGAVLDAREIPGSTQVVCTFSSCHDRPWGAIAIIDRNKGLEVGPENKENPVLFTLPPQAINDVGVGGYDQFSRLKVKYEDPYPLTDEFFLCSRMNEGERMALILFDLDGHETVVLEEQKYGIYDAMPLAQRPMPREILSRVDKSKKTGTFYVSDVYQSQEMQDVKPGEVKFLRVVESPEKRYWTHNFWSLAGEQAPAMNWHDYSNKRILGTVPVEADGSANFEVPADTFVYFQLLDQEGKMLHSMRSGTIVRPGENQGCVGCHEDRLSAAPIRPKQKAMERPADKLKLPSWLPQEEFSFMKHVQPIFTKNCMKCHDFDGPGSKSVVLAPDRNLLFNAAYHSIQKNGLIAVPGAGPTKTIAAKKWGALQSRLAKVILKGHGDDRDKNFNLSTQDKEIVITWIDINAPYYPTFATNYRDNIYGRSPLADADIDRLAKLTGVAFPNTKLQWKPEARNCWQIAFERPEKSPCLNGLDKNSDAWKEAVAIIQKGADTLKKRPRADMPGFKMLDEQDLRCEKHYQDLQK